MSTIKLNKVIKKYDDKLVLDRVTLEIEEGEFVVVVGPSGCGKTTLLNVIAGLENLSDGDVFFDEKNVNGLSPAERDIGFVFQNYSVYPHLTVFDNLAFGLKFKNINSTEFEEYRNMYPKALKRDIIKCRVKSVAKTLGITSLLNIKPGQRPMSGGQLQRIAIGRALVRKPNVFLFDEPFSNLDEMIKVRLRSEVAAIQRKLGITSIFVTHDHREAMALAQRVVILNAGVVEQIGSPEKVYKFPSSLFVANFFGSPKMNFFNRRHLGTIVKTSNADLIPSEFQSAGFRSNSFLLSEPVEPYLELDLKVFNGRFNGIDYTHEGLMGEEIITLLLSKPFYNDKYTFFIPIKSIHFFDENGQRIKSKK